MASRTRSASTTALLLIVPLALVLTGCSAGGGTTAATASGAASAVDTSAPLYASLPKAVTDKKEITAGSDIAYAPFESYDTDNTTVIGIDRDIADLLQKQLGVPITFEKTAFDALVPGLAAGRFDLVWSAIGDTPARAEAVDFVDYFKTGYGILIKDEDQGKISTLDDLCGLTIGVLSGSTSADDADAQSQKCVADGAAPMTVSAFKAQSDMNLALSTGRTEAAMITHTAGADLAKTVGGLTMLDAYRSVNFGIAMQKGSNELGTAIQKALDATLKDGSYAAVLEKYKLSAAALTEFTTTIK